jgi:RNA polymerase sigma-70 factor (ECF subfamily)
MLKVWGLRLVRGAPSERPEPKVEDDLAGLITRFRSGDRKAVRTLLVSLAPPMLQVIRRVLGAHHPDLDDTLQESTIALLGALRSFRGECTARHFACRIAAFTAITARRRRRVDDQTTPPGDFEEQPFGELDPSAENDWAITARRRRLVRQLLDELPEAQAGALVLHCVAGLTVGELASATGVPLETARSRLRLAKAALRLRIASDPAACELIEEAT